MPTLDDDPIATDAPDTPEFGVDVQSLLDAAAASPRVRTQALGRKGLNALSEVKATLKREQQIAAAEAELSRLRRGGA